MKLKVKLFRVKDTGVLGWIEEQEGIKRGCGEIISDGKFRIFSGGGPEIDQNTLFIQGSEREPYLYKGAREKLTILSCFTILVQKLTVNAGSSTSAL